MILKIGSLLWGPLGNASDLGWAPWFIDQQGGCTSGGWWAILDERGMDHTSLILLWDSLDFPEQGQVWESEWEHAGLFRLRLGTGTSLLLHSVGQRKSQCQLRFKGRENRFHFLMGRPYCKIILQRAWIWQGGGKTVLLPQISLLHSNIKLVTKSFLIPPLGYSLFLFPLTTTVFI